MKSQNSTCIIIGHTNLGESDKIIHIYSEEFGKLRVIAKGARKITSKFTGHLETLNICDVSLYFGPRNIILSEVITIKSFKKLREDLEKLKCALVISEVINQLIYENQKIENLIQFAKENLEKICESNRPQLITQSFIIKILDIIGLIPDFKNIDSSLEEKYLKFLHYIQTKTINEIEKISLSLQEETKIQEIIKDIIEYQIDKPLKSLSI
ncbi:MAG: DNA repair protein RecO [bacterium]|nr:DNA repair protein RecO [bacterium]